MVKRETRKLTDEWTRLCSEAVLMMNALDRAGLHRTARKMDAVVKHIGWEVAELLEASDGR